MEIFQDPFTDVKKEMAAEREAKLAAAEEALQREVAKPARPVKSAVPAIEGSGSTEVGKYLKRRLAIN